jgi:hypothetical protein
MGRVVFPPEPQLLSRKERGQGGCEEGEEKGRKRKATEI